MHLPLMRALRTSSSILLATVVCGCEDSFEATIDNVSGSYAAVTFTSTQQGATTDHLAEGASFSITLAPDGTTTGRLFVPGGGEGGADLDADMAGTWTLTGNTVEFAQTADTFVTDVAFIAESNRLRAEASFNDVTIRVVLTK